MKLRAEFESQLPNEFKKLSVVLGIISIALLAVNYFGQKMYDVFGALNLIAVIFAFASYLVFSFEARLIITPLSCDAEYKMWLFRFKTSQSLTSFKSIRSCYRSMNQGDVVMPKKYIQIDFSASKEDHLQPGDLRLSDHLVYDYDENAKVVAKVLNEIQQVTGFEIIMPNVLGAKIEPELDKLRGKIDV